MDTFHRKNGRTSCYCPRLDFPHRHTPQCADVYPVPKGAGDGWTEDSRHNDARHKQADSINAQRYRVRGDK